MGLERAGNCGVAAITVKKRQPHRSPRQLCGAHRRSQHDRPALRQLTRRAVPAWPLGAVSPGAWPPTRWRAAGPTEKAAHSCWTLRPAWWPRARCESSATEGSRSPRDGSSTRLASHRRTRRTFTTSRAAASCPLAASWATRGYGLGVVVELLGGALSGAGLCAGPEGADRQRLLLAGHRHWALPAVRRVRGPSAGVRRLFAVLAQGRRRRCHPAARRAGKARATAASGRRGRSRKKLGGKSSIALIGSEPSYRAFSTRSTI